MVIIMSWFWDLLSKKEQMKQQGRNMAMDVFNKGRASDIRGLLGTAQQDAVIAEGFGSRDRLYEQGLIDKPITGRNSAFSDRLYSPLQEAQAGTGYFGSDRGIDAQTQLMGDAMGAGLSQGQAMGLLQPTQNEESKQQDMQKYMLGEQIKQKNRKELSTKERLTAENSLRDRYIKQRAPSKTSIKYYNKGADLYSKAKFNGDKLSGTDSLTLARYYLKQTLPDESVMSDDIGNLTFSQGVPEYVQGWLARLFGDGSMSKDAAEEILQTMHTGAQFEVDKADEARSQYSQEAEDYGLSTRFLGERQEARPLPFGQGGKPPTREEAAAELRRRQMSGTIQR